MQQKKKLKTDVFTDEKAIRVELRRDWMPHFKRPDGSGALINADLLIPKRIIQHGPATIVIWGDDTKTVVKYDADETQKRSLYWALAAATMKRIYNSTGEAIKASEHNTTIYIDRTEPFDFRPLQKKGGLAEFSVPLKLVSVNLNDGTKEQLDWRHGKVFFARPEREVNDEF